MNKTPKMLEVEEQIGESLERMLRREYVKNERTFAEIGEEIGVHSSSVSSWTDALGIPKKERLPEKAKKATGKQLKKWYEDNGESIREIAARLGVGNETARKMLAENGITIRSLSEAKRSKTSRSVKKADLQRMYEVDRKTSYEIADILGLEQGAVLRLMKKYGIRARSASEVNSPEGYREPTKRQLQRWYMTKRLNTREIADKLGLAQSTVCSLLKRKGIKIRSNSDAHLTTGVRKATEKKLRRMYLTERKGMPAIAKQLGVCQYTVRMWLKEYDIPTRTVSEARLPKGFRPPSKKKLERLYVKERRNSPEVGKILGVSTNTVHRLLKEHGIPMRGRSEVQLRTDVKKPTKQELKRIYVTEKQNAPKIAESYGVSSSLVYRWLRSYKIRVRTEAESKLPHGAKILTKKQLEKLYIKERQSMPKIAKHAGVTPKTIRNWLDRYEIPVRSGSEARFPAGFTKPTKQELKRLYLTENMSLEAIAKMLGIGSTTVKRWVTEYGISHPKRRKLSDKQFMDFLKKEEPARNLAAAAVSMNGDGLEVERMICEIYDGKFRDQEELHSLLEQNTSEIYDLIEGGMTNITHYIGTYTVEERPITPTLIVAAIDCIPEERITASLEDRLAKLLRVPYSPLFNQDPEKTVKAVQQKVKEAAGKHRKLYRKLHAHYKDTLKLQRELGGLQ